MVLVLAVIAFLVMAVATWYSLDMGGGDGLFDYVMGTILSSVFGAIAATIVFFGGSGLANLALAHQDLYQRVRLVAIRDGSGVNGTFVWGTGSVGSTGNYRFYYQDGAAKQLVNVDGSKVKLFEDSQDAYAILFMGCDLSPAWVAPCFSNLEAWNEIHVPPGSVKSQIDLGLNP